MARESSLTQAAYERLRAELLSCRLVPGERLRINDLCEQLAVSLGAVREALSRLTSDGLVVAEPQRGFRVAPISALDLQDLTMVRTEIEGMCLRRAIERGDVAWESQVVSAYHRLSRTSERASSDSRRVSDDFARAHEAFHDALVAACDSPWLLRLRSQLYAQSERYRRLSLPLSRYRRDTNREHRELMDAAIERDAQRAAERMGEHIGTTTRILLDALGTPTKGLSAAKASATRKRASARAA